MVKNGKRREKETQPCEKREWWRLVGNKWMSVVEDRIASQLFRVPINRGFMKLVLKRKFWQGTSWSKAESVTLCHERVSFSAQNKFYFVFTELSHKIHQGEKTYFPYCKKRRTTLAVFCPSALGLEYWFYQLIGADRNYRYWQKNLF